MVQDPLRREIGRLISPPPEGDISLKEEKVNPSAEGV
jgi:hypothetical protein